MQKHVPIRPLPWVCCGILGAGAFVLKFLLPGYGFSALVCCCIIGIIAFYEVTRMLRGYYPRAMRRLRRVFTGVLCVGLAVVAVTEGLIIRASFGTASQPVEYVLVLGAKVRSSGPSASLWDRIYAARDYLEANPDTIAIVSGGQGEDEPMTEAQAMYDELTKLGIDGSRIWMEEEASSTWENLNFSLALIQEKTGATPTKLGVLSSEYHLFRASLFARRCGVEFVGIPARTSQPGQRINHFLREVAGVWHYILLGGQYD